MWSLTMREGALCDTAFSSWAWSRGAALAAALPLLATPSAFADYAPSKGDVVGVGADTLQYTVDFLADGDAYGDTGYNQLGNKNKLISFDATGDANAQAHLRGQRRPGYPDRLHTGHR